MGAQREVESPYTRRDPALVVDSSSLTEDDYRVLVQWLDEKGQRPSACIVESASKHDLTLIGEGLHGVKPFLDLLNEIIKAGVTCIALEVCPSFNNRALDPMPHETTAEMSAISRCRQCHVFDTTDDVFAGNTFAGLQQDLRRGRRLNPIAPPTIPPKTFMRENCATCQFLRHDR